MQTTELTEADVTQFTEETKDLNLAVYITGVKQCKVKHRKRGKTLYFRFAILREEMVQYKEDYVNSEQAICDSVRRNFFQILNED